MDGASGSGSSDLGPVVPLYYDTVFRWLFGSYRQVTGKFLQAALPEVPSDEWADLTLPDTHLLGTARQKEMVLDVHVATASMRSVDVEVQMSSIPAARERFTAYSCKQLASQLSPGQPYTALRPVITLVVCGFVLFEEDEDYQHTFFDYDPDHKIRFTDIRQTRTLELPKVPAQDDGTDLWDWLRLIAATTEEEIDMAAKRNTDVAQAAVLVKEFSADETRRLEAVSREKFLSDQATREAYSHEQGFEQGRCWAVRRMVAGGMPVEQVAVVLDIAPGEVAAIIGAG